MSVELDPSTQLSFTRPFTQLVKELLTVSNPNHEPVAFKVKTTAPKQYCVRPNSGRIEAGQSVSVQVILQPMKEDPPLDFKCKDKFLVQSVAITPDRETLNLPELWAITEKQSKELIKENKIRCIYLPAPGTVQAINPNNQQTTSTRAASPVEQQTYSAYPTISEKTAAATASYDAQPISAVKHVEHRPAPVNVTNGYGGHNNNNNVPSTPSIIGTFPQDLKEQSIRPIKSYTNNSNDASDDETARLRRQLYESQEEVKRLNHIIDTYKQDLNAAQLRQRKSEEIAEKATRNISSASVGYPAIRTQERIPEGYYPFEVVIGAAIGAFLFGVMFF
ncbi:13095_t:CDS:2 [Ambispora gerdemannii]|uniref:13095_t:CDS:1 n=1 Tax=Ambispora gerdemannii TaxID=144530 RepID=A0A9N8WPP0_9GLOM|nr:13095_t:CDS:2 [Ambispora gerdemannii]